MIEPILSANSTTVDDSPEQNPDFIPGDHPKRDIKNPNVFAPKRVPRTPCESSCSRNPSLDSSQSRDVSEQTQVVLFEQEEREGEEPNALDRITAIWKVIENSVGRKEDAPKIRRKKGDDHYDLDLPSMGYFLKLVRGLKGIPECHAIPRTDYIWGSVIAEWHRRLLEYFGADDGHLFDTSDIVARVENFADELEAVWDNCTTPDHGAVMLAEVQGWLRNPESAPFDVQFWFEHTRKDSQRAAGAVMHWMGQQHKTFPMPQRRLAEYVEQLGIRAKMSDGRRSKFGAMALKRLEEKGFIRLVKKGVGIQGGHANEYELTCQKPKARNCNNRRSK